MVFKTLPELSHRDIGLETRMVDYRKHRMAVRAFLYNEVGKLAMLYVTKDQYYKLPGGGMEPGESLLESLKRELLEEVGATYSIAEPFCAIREFREDFELIHDSYYFIAEVDGELQPSAFTELELSEGFSLCWMTPDEALEALHSSHPDRYIGKMIVARDERALTAYMAHKASGNER